MAIYQTNGGGSPKRGSKCLIADSNVARMSDPWPWRNA